MGREFDASRDGAVLGNVNLRNLWLLEGHVAMEHEVDGGFRQGTAVRWGLTRDGVVLETARE